MTPLRRYPAALTALALLAAGCGGGRPGLKVGMYADGEVVEAEGFVQYSDDLVDTKERALVAARRAAVEKVVGVYISAKTKVSKATLVDSRILADTKGYISRHEIMKEKREGDFYRMTIRAMVKFQKVESDLRAAGVLDAQAVGNPRVAVLLEEYVGKTDADGTEAAVGMAEAFIEKGFTVVDRSAMAGAEAQKMLDAMDRGEKQGVMDLGSRVKAEIVVIGQARAAALKTEGLGGFVSYRANLSAQAVKAGSGQVLGAVSQAASGMDVNRPAAASKSLRNAGIEAGKELADKIMLQLENARGEVVVAVSGVTELSALGELQESLRKAAGVSGVQLRSFSPGAAELSVTTDFTAADLAGKLGAFKAPPLKVDSVEASKIAVSLR